MQVPKGCLEGPFEFDPEAKLPVREKLLEVNPAYRFGEGQGEKLRAVDDLAAPTKHRPSTHRSTFVRGITSHSCAGSAAGEGAAGR